MSSSAPAEDATEVTEVIEIIINGEARRVAAGATIKDLMGVLGLGGKPVAVERNREVVPRARHGETVLGDGDRLEVVTFVGGG
jgi:sulfur carrier protein